MKIKKTYRPRIKLDQSAIKFRFNDHQASFDPKQVSELIKSVSKRAGLSGLVAVGLSAGSTAKAAASQGSPLTSASLDGARTTDTSR